MGTGYSLAHLSAGPLSPRNPTSHTVHLCDARPAGRGAHCPAVFVCVAHLALEMTALFILFERIPPQASLAHILSGSCAGNKEEARHFMRKLDKHTARATARVERAAPDSKDTATSLRRARPRAASLKAINSLDSERSPKSEEEYDKIAPP